MGQARALPLRGVAVKVTESEIAVDLSAQTRTVDLAGWPGDDIIQPFMIDKTGLHGRYVRLGSSVDAILNRHDLPEAVATLLGEFMALALGLAAALKYDGIFTLQTKGEGAVPMMVADVTSGGAVRGYAQVREGERETIPDWETVKTAPVPKLLGAGYLAFTVDFSTSTERYQGIVSLDGATLEDVIQHYFEQSAQFTARARLACGRDANGRWRASALVIQHLPAEGGSGGVQLGEDDWRRAVTLLNTATMQEMTDPALPAHDLLYRLFNEDGVRVWRPRPVSDSCRCSRDKMLSALTSLPDEEVESVLVDGALEMVCEFCNVKRTFTRDDIVEARDRGDEE